MNNVPSYCKIMSVARLTQVNLFLVWDLSFFFLLREALNPVVWVYRCFIPILNSNFPSPIQNAPKSALHFPLCLHNWILGFIGGLRTSGRHLSPFFIGGALITCSHTRTERHEVGHSTAWMRGKPMRSRRAPGGLLGSSRRGRCSREFRGCCSVCWGECGQQIHVDGWPGPIDV